MPLGTIGAGCFTHQLPFLYPNQQLQSTEENYTILQLLVSKIQQKICNMTKKQEKGVLKAKKN